MKVVETVSPVPETPPIGPLATVSAISSASTIGTGLVTSDTKISSCAALQIVYNPHECNEGSGIVTDLTLCIITPSVKERDDWLWHIRLGKFHYIEINSTRAAD